MKHTYNFQPQKSYHDQQTLPISPQNFDPLDKSKDLGLQKKAIFSATPTKPKGFFEEISEVENPQVKPEDNLVESDLKRLLAKEMRAQLESLKAEIFDGFSAVLKNSRNNNRINNEDVQEIKKQIISNKNKFEEIQEHMAYISQQYTNVNSLCVRELENLKSSSNLSGLSKGGDVSMIDEMTKAQLDSQFRSFKQELISEITAAIKGSGKPKLTEDVVGELKQIKHSFESELKQNFDIINGRVKRGEENLNEIMRKKRDYMEAIRDEALSSIDHQNMALTQEIKYLEDMTKSKCEYAQAKVIVNAEINKRMELFKSEADALRKAVASNQEEMDRISTLTNRKLESLEYSMKKQFFEMQGMYQKGGASQQKIVDPVEKRINKLNGDSEGYLRTIHQLRAQVEEVLKVHKLLQVQASTSSSQELIRRLESKIENLQDQIHDIEMQVRKQKQASNMSPGNSEFMRNSPSHPRLSAGLEDQKSRGGQRFMSPQGEYEQNPKVKSIIDEYHQKRRQTQASPITDIKSSGEKPDTLRVDNRRLETMRSASDKVAPNRSPDRPQAVTAPQTQRGQDMGNSSYLRNQRGTENAGGNTSNQKVESKGSQEAPQAMRKKNPGEKIQDSKKLKHAKILAQINYFINGTASDLLDEEEDADLYCNLDDDGYIFDEDDDFVLDERGNKVKLTPEQIEKFNNNNMIE